MDAHGEGSISDATMENTIQVLCQRAKALGYPTAQIRRSGQFQLEIRLPADVPASVASAIATDTRFAIYDWEASVIEPGGAGRLAGQPIRSKKRAEDVAAEHPDAIVVTDRSGTGSGYFVIRDQPALSLSDIMNPREVELPPAPASGSSGEVQVSFEFTDRGSEKFERLTKLIAERGARNSSLDTDREGRDHLRFADHFAVVVNGDVVALPIVDFVSDPQGIQSKGGSFGTGLSRKMTRELARLLQIGPPPVTLTPTR